MSTREYSHAYTRTWNECESLVLDERASSSRDAIDKDRSADMTF